MKIRSAISIFVILSVFVSIDLLAQSGAGKGRGRIKGTVTDPEGKPIPDVTVKFSNESLQTSFETKTDEKGEWTVNGIAGGNWNIDFVKQGFVEKKITNQIASLGFNKPVELSLERAQAASSVAAGGQKAVVPGMDLMTQGNQLKASKDYPGAIAKYEAAIAANPSLYAAYGEIGLIYSEMNQPDKAAEAFNKLLEKDPGNADAAVDLANLYFKQGKTEEAKKALSGLDISKVTNASTLYNLGVGFYNAQQNEEAIKYWEKAVSIDPNMTDAWFQLAVAYYGVQNLPKAKEAFQKVIAMAPDSENAKMAQEMLDTMK